MRIAWLTLVNEQKIAIDVDKVYAVYGEEHYDTRCHGYVDATRVDMGATSALVRGNVETIMKKLASTIDEV